MCRRQCKPPAPGGLPKERLAADERSRPWTVNRVLEWPGGALPPPDPLHVATRLRVRFAIEADVAGAVFGIAAVRVHVLTTPIKTELNA